MPRHPNQHLQHRNQLMHTRSTLAALLLCSSALVPLALTGCAGEGRCVGVAGAGRPTDTQKVLENVDKDGVAIQGYDPVAYFTQSKPVKGDAKFRSIYRGAVYQFASADDKSMFDAKPAKYAPQFGGYCAYAAS